MKRLIIAITLLAMLSGCCLEPYLTSSETKTLVVMNTKGD